MKSEPSYWGIDESNFNTFLMEGSKAVGLQMSPQSPRATKCWELEGWMSPSPQGGLNSQEENWELARDTKLFCLSAHLPTNFLRH